MIARYDRPVSAAAFLARRVSLFAVALFVVGTLAHRLGSLSTENFLAIAGLAALLSVAGVLFALVGIWRLWQVGAKGGWASFMALVSAMIVLVPAGYAGWLYVDLPAIRDISSDLADPPQWLVPPLAGGTWLPHRTTPPADRASLQAGAYPQIVGRRYEGAMDRVLQAVKMAVRDEDMKVVAETGTEGAAPADVEQKQPAAAAGQAAAETPPPAAGSIPIPLDRPSPIVPDALPAEPRTVRIQAVHRSAVFGLTSDVVIRLTEDAETTVVDMRVVARYGDSDLGGGAALIRSFFGNLDGDLLGIASQ